VSQDELESRRRQKLKFKDTGFARADSNDEKANQEQAWAREKYYGETMVKTMQKEGDHEDVNDLEVSQKQEVAMRLYESRIAALQRAVSMFVMFHELGKRVQDFWPNWTLGYLGYDMSRTHSIMRIATTASPVSGAEVRDRTLELAKKTRLKGSIAAIGRCVSKKRQHIRKLVRMSGQSPIVSPVAEEASLNSSPTNAGEGPAKGPTNGQQKHL